MNQRNYTSDEIAVWVEKNKELKVLSVMWVRNWFLVRVKINARNHN